MTPRTDRITAALGGIKQRMADKDTLIEELTAARDALQARKDLPDWLSLQGETISEGQIVRSGLLTYRARSEHTWALVRSPANLVYWEVVAQ